MWINLIKTWMVEIPILWLFLHRFDRTENIIGLGMLINASTWTFLTYYYYQYGGNVYLLEVLVALAEGVWIRNLWQTSWLRSLSVSFLSNALSFGLGWWGLI
ncbi:MAG: hypothetical protein U0X91_32040 [Spirosomataceae bacterium]